MNEKIYPTVEELSVRVNVHICPECSSVFKTEPNLILHRKKTHKLDQLSLKRGEGDNKIYHCPFTTCAYNSSKSFPQFKLIRQHFLKIHSEKTFECKLCEQRFATQAFKNRHEEYCNVVFKCCDCDAFYWNYDCLNTHGRRKKHRILKKIQYKTSSVQITQQSSTKIRKLILPKAPSKTRMNIGTQTICERMSSITASTQTDFITDSHTSTSNLLITDTFDSNFFNCNTETQTDFMLNDELFKCCDYYANMHTQTCEDLLMEITHSETQTPFDLKSVESQTVSGNSISLSNMETQTDVEFQQFLAEINS